MISDLLENKFRIASFSMPDPPIDDGEDDEEDEDKTTGNG